MRRGFHWHFDPDKITNASIRSVRSVNEKDKSILFRADIPQGSYCCLMRTNPNSLLDGAREAAEVSAERLGEKAGFAVAISCRGRKFILRQRTEEKLENLIEALGADVPIAGYYSYGEISRSKRDSLCKIHNQTLTLTLFAE